MADSLIYDLMERHLMPDPKMTVQELDSGNFEKLIVAQTGISKEIFAFSGNEVIYVKYFGKMQLITLLHYCRKLSTLVKDRAKNRSRRWTDGKA
jgi:hypothetical protein